MTNWLDRVMTLTDQRDMSLALDLLGTTEGDLPDRTKEIQGACRHIQADPDLIDGTPCGWVGFTSLALFDDTEEAIWHCPHGHENSERYADFA